MSATEHPPPPPPPAAAKPDLDEWLAELAEKTSIYRNARRNQELRLKAAGDQRQAAEQWEQEAITTLREIAAMMRQRCGTAFLADLADLGRPEADRRALGQLDEVDPDETRWTVDVGDGEPIDLADPDREEKPDVD